MEKQKIWTSESKKKAFEAVLGRIIEREGVRKSLKKSEREGIKSLWQVIRWMEKIKTDNLSYLFECGEKEDKLFEDILLKIENVKTEKLSVERLVFQIDQRKWLLQKMYRSEVRHLEAVKKLLDL